MKNENKQDDMISIMEHLLKNVPAVIVDDSIVNPETEEKLLLIHRSVILFCLEETN